MILRSALSALALFGLSSGFAAAQDITAPPGVTLAPGESAATLLPALIAHSRHVATLREGRLSGEGAEFLRALGSQAHFVMLGEDHGHTGVAQFSAAYWRDLNAAGFNYAAIETDFAIADAATRELRAGGVVQWSRFVQERGGVLAAPFLTWAPEAELGELIVRTSHGRETPLWGLDQVFIGSAAWQLQEIAARAHRREAREAAASLAQEGVAAMARGELSWFPQVETARLEALRALLSDRRDAEMADWIDAMIVSQRIYRPFTGGPGEAYLANLERETLMKRAFLAHYAAAERADRTPPRVLLKFGENHMYRGASPTWVQALGGFVSDYASTRDLQSLTLSVRCGPGGSVRRQITAPGMRCEELLAEEFPFLADYIDPEQITIFDLRVWRLRPSRWAHLPADFQRRVGSFDVLIFVPGGAEAPFLPGLTEPVG